jgi:hypothetical protein
MRDFVIRVINWLIKFFGIEIPDLYTVNQIKSEYFKIFPERDPINIEKILHDISLVSKHKDRIDSSMDIMIPVFQNNPSLVNVDGDLSSTESLEAPEIETLVCRQGIINGRECIILRISSTLSVFVYKDQNPLSFFTIDQVFNSLEFGELLSIVRSMNPGKMESFEKMIYDMDRYYHYILDKEYNGGDQQLSAPRKESIFKAKNIN